MKVLVAIPVYDAKVPIQTASCLMSELALAIVSGDEIQISFLPNCSHPAMGRNQLADDFMKSDCERLFFLDSDVTFEPGALLKLAKAPVDFAGGAYRYKTAKEIYPVEWIKGRNELWVNRAGFIEVETLPGGFMSLSRKVFENIKVANPDREYVHHGRTVFAYFQMPFKDGCLYGEDSFFCTEWRKSGGQVWLDPELTLTHWEFNRPFTGQIGSWIKSNTKEEVTCEL